MILKILKSFWLRREIILSAFLFIYLFQGCKEDGEVVPNFNTSGLKINDLIIEVNSVTTLGDTITTSATSENLLGKLNDQVYGLSTSEIFSQLYMKSTSLNITDDISFDSIILYLNYDNSYGFDYTQEVQVYELTEAMSDPKYSSNDTIASSADLLGSTTITVASTDNYTDSTEEVLRVKLSDELANRIKQKAVFQDQNEWLEFFKGIRITTNATNVPSAAGDGSGAIVYFNLLNRKTKMSLYYQEASSGNTISLDFDIVSESARFSHFENTYADSLNNVLDKEDENYNFIFAMGGSRTRITFIDIDSIAQSLGEIAINKAELVIPYEKPTLENYDPPLKNVIIYQNLSGTWVLPSDFFTGGSDYFGGNLDLKNQEYRFNLASTMHDIINNGNYDRELYLTVSGGAVSANRLKLNSGIHPKRKIYLVLSFTKSG